MDAIKNVWNKVVAFFKKCWCAVSAFVKKVWSKVADFTKKVWGKVAGFVKEKTKNVNWKAVWDKCTTGLLIFLMASPILILTYIVLWFLFK